MLLPQIVNLAVRAIIVDNLSYTHTHTHTDAKTRIHAHSLTDSNIQSYIVTF